MIVRSGSPLQPGIAPLIPTGSWTIEGLERFGGSAPTGGAGAAGGGRGPVGTNLVSRSRSRGRGPRLSAPPTGRRGLSGATIANASGAASTAFRVGDRW